MRRLIALTAASILMFAACQSPDGERPISNGSSPQAIDSLVIELTGADSQSVVQLLIAEHRVSFQLSAMGIFVTGIDSVENSATAFWIYSVNDTTPPVACDRLFTHDGDRVVWHYRRRP
jgi:hypothetical protein